MKIKQTTSRKKPILITILILLLVVSALTMYAYMKKIGPFANSTSSTSPAINYDPPSKEEKETGESIKESITDTAPGSDPLPAPTPSTDGSKPTVGIKITAAAQNGTTLSIRTLLQTISSTGTCALNMTGPAGKSYTASAEVQAGPSSSTCKGFDIPVSSLAPGNWDVTVVFENDTVKGSDTTKGIVIQ